MLTTLERLIDRADGQYLRPEHLEQLTTYSQSFTERSETYAKIQKLETKLLDNLLKQAGLSDIQTREDLTQMLRACALGMLLDDTAYLRENYLDSLVRQTLAYGTQARSHRLATLLNASLAKQLPLRQALLLRPFLDLVCQALL